MSLFPYRALLVTLDRKLTPDMTQILVAVLSVPASGWALLAGALIGAATSVLTGIRLDSGQANPPFAALSVGAYLFSGVAFGWLSVLLEQLRAESPDHKSFVRRLAAPRHRRRLGPMMTAGVLLLVAGTTFLFLM